MSRRRTGQAISVPPSSPLPKWAQNKPWGSHAWDVIRWVFHEARRRGLTMTDLADGSGVTLTWLRRLHASEGQTLPDYAKITAVLHFLGGRLDIVDAGGQLPHRHREMVLYEGDAEAANLIEQYPGIRKEPPQS